MAKMTFTMHEIQFNGFPLEITRGFQQQILHALVRMDEIGVIHCDLKPENVLLVGYDCRNEPNAFLFLSDGGAHLSDMSL
jgi:serine/threonine protein kinase